MSSILSVSQLNKYIQFKIQSDLKLKGIAVRGELSNFSVHYKSGHAYFTLKDENSAVKCVMFSKNADRLKFIPENGMSVLVSGNVDVYERDGVYQIIATDIQPLGIGALHTGIEQLKEKLAAKGVFEQSAKKKIPYLPKTIAVVTSVTGAALQDILNILSRRYPAVKVKIYPAQVQGSAAPDSISSALSKADAGGADTIILARGGGSLEDLMPFNSEIVAMAVFECKTPIISAVGHETDTTIADFAADMRAPTPSAAAELAVPKTEELLSACDLMRNRLSDCMIKYLSKCGDKLETNRLKLTVNSPIERLKNNENKIERIAERLDYLMKAKLTECDTAVDKFAAQLNALSPFNILERGYSITTKENTVISSSKQLESGDEVVIRFRDSSCKATIM